MIYRVLIIILNTVITSYTIFKMDVIITPIVLITILILQIVELYHWNRRRDDKLIAYIESFIIDESVSNQRTSNRLFNRVYIALKDYLSQSESLSIQNQEYIELLSNLLEHINIGIIIYSVNDKKIILENRAVRTILNLSNHQNIDIDRLKDTEPHIHSQQTDFLLNSYQVRILSFQNIESSLSKNEMQSWNQLLRTLNHEIMNSITPIISLADSAININRDSTNSDLIDALNIIQNRSKGLLNFVEHYRTITNIPNPNREIVVLKEIIENSSKLLKSLIIKKHIIIKTSISDDTRLYVDKTLIENVLINLLKNAIEAVATEISIIAELYNESTIIKIVDNGSGFSQESINNAFLPFYTTKNSGSGVGLSFVRQVMNLHNGQITIEEQDHKTVIKLIFP